MRAASFKRVFLVFIVFILFFLASCTIVVHNRPPRPRPHEAVWVSGHWEPRGLWVPGHWAIR